VIGCTSSPDPVTPGAYRQSLNGADGSVLVFCGEDFDHFVVKIAFGN